MIKFRCSQCNQKIGVPETAVGKKVKCPKCSKVLEIPNIVSCQALTEEPVESYTSSLVEALEKDAQSAPKLTITSSNHDLKLTESTKLCPFCGETILEIAKKCKHCGEFINKSNLQKTQKAPNVKYDSEIIGIVILSIPIVATCFLLYSLTGFISLSPQIYLVISLSTVLTTSVLMAIEASKLQMGKALSGKRETGPIGWLIGGLLLWLIVYPLYLFQRRKFGVKNMAIYGLFIVVFFTLVSFGTSFKSTLSLGTKMEFNGGDLFYTAQLTESEATKLGQYLVSDGFFNGKRISVQIDKDGSTYEFKMVIKKGIENDTQYIEIAKTMALELSENVFNHQQVDIHLCDENFKTLRVVVGL